MAEKILVALDQSPFSELVFEEGLKLAKSFNAALMLLHVLSSDEEGSPQLPLAATGPNPYVILETAVMEQYQKRWREYEEAGLNFLRSYSERAITDGVTAEFTQLLGRPGRTTCELAKSWGADLVVIGRRGRSGLSEFLLGSVSNYVVHHASCQVYVVQSKRKSV